MTNLQVINTIQAINNNSDLLKKKLPIKVLFALKRNISKLNSAADDYRNTLATLCEQHDVDPVELNDGGIKPELMTEINALLAENADVTVATVPVSLLEQCGDTYDALTYAELEALEFMLEDTPEVDAT
ncbi:MAG: hypothetical protein Q4F79_07405 [Eubacteriales bacterium]|nr:hypothetical protein [Eubacteriales bacterium]